MVQISSKMLQIWLRRLGEPRSFDLVQKSEPKLSVDDLQSCFDIVAKHG